MLFARCLKGSIGTKHGGGAEKERDVLSLNYDPRGKTCVRTYGDFFVWGRVSELTQSGTSPGFCEPTSLSHALLEERGDQSKSESELVSQIIGKRGRSGQAKVPRAGVQE